MSKQKITQERWNNTMNKLTIEHKMSTDDAYNWMKERFTVKDQVSVEAIEFDLEQ